jgi:hypothetical protein
MGADKIAAFYDDDPVKKACAPGHQRKPIAFARCRLTTGFAGGRFLGWLGEGLLRRVRGRFIPGPKFRVQSSSSSSSLSSSA